MHFDGFHGTESKPQGFDSAPTKGVGLPKIKQLVHPMFQGEAELRCLGRNKHQPGANTLEYIIFQKYF